MAGAALAVAHAVPGRVRLKVAKLRGNPDLARQAETRLQQVPGIQRVEARPTTGSLLIYYDLALLLAEGTLAALTEGFAELLPELGTEVIMTELETLSTQLLANPTPGSGSMLVGAITAINHTIARLTGGLDLRLLLPLGLFFLGVRSLMKAEKIPLPSWYDYFWFAFSTFVMLNRQLVDKPKAEKTSSSGGT